MSEEEKEARDILVNEIADILVGEYCKQCKICENEDIECYYGKAIDTIDDLIRKQQEEIEDLEKQIKLMQNCDLVEKIEGQEALIDNLKHNETVYQEIIEKQQKEIEDLEIKTKAVTAYHFGDLPTDVEMIILSKNDFERNISNDYISKDKIIKVIKKYYDDYEEQKSYRYTLDVEDEQAVLKDIERELLEE